MIAQCQEYATGGDFFAIRYRARTIVGLELIVGKVIVPVVSMGCSAQLGPMFDTCEVCLT